MTAQHLDLEDLKGFPSFEARWAPVYLEPIVQSGERLTIGVVGRANNEVEGRLTVTDQALRCLYGEAAPGIRNLIELALKRALKYAERDFDPEFRSGIHGVVLGHARSGFGDNLIDVIEQGIALTSSLSTVHPEENRSHDRTSYWVRIQKAMQRVDSELVPHFGHQIDIRVRGSSIQLPCDYFSSRLAINICSLSADARLNQNFDTAMSKAFRLEQLKDHDALIGHSQDPSIMLVVPNDSVMQGWKDKARKNFSERMLLIQDVAERKHLSLVTVHSPFEGAKLIRQLERAA